MSSLFDFEDREAPTIKCLRWIPHPVTDGMVGTIGGELTQDKKCALFLHRRDHNENHRRTYNNKFDGYAISDWVIDLMGAMGVYVVYIAVTDRETVMEFDLKQYQNGIAFEWREGDPQKCVPQDNAKYEWEGDAAEILNPNDTQRLDVSRFHKQ